MKMPIQWHEDCLKNYRGTVERARKQVDKALLDFNTLLTQCNKYEIQIITAKSRKLTGFDPDRFLKKK